MDAHTTFILMVIFAAAASLCLVVQVVLLSVMAVSSLKVKKQTAELVAKVEPIIAKVGPILDTSQQLAEEIRRYAEQISSKTNDILDLSRQQLVRVDDVLGEAASRTRAQMDRIEMVMDDTVNRFQETTTLFQNTIVRPLRQINAVTSGLRAALAYLTGGRRTTVENATHDEEMFI